MVIIILVAHNLRGGTHSYTHTRIHTHTHAHNLYTKNYRHRHTAGRGPVELQRHFPVVFPRIPVYRKTYIYAYIYMSIYVYVWPSGIATLLPRSFSQNTCVHTYSYIYIRICTYTCVCVPVRRQRQYPLLSPRILAYTTYLCICKCIHICVWPSQTATSLPRTFSVYTQICIYTYAYGHMYIYVAQRNCNVTIQ